MIKNTPKQKIALKKKLLVIVGLLLLFNVSIQAANRYWIGGSGNWNSTAHWSAVSGGAPGASIPLSSDDVIFDEYSTDYSALTISLSTLSKCHNLTVSPDCGSIEFVGVAGSVWSIYGSMSFSSYVKNSFVGEIDFLGTGTKTVDFKTAMPNGSVRFSGNSTWNLTSNLFLSFYAKIIIEEGQVNASNVNMQAFGIQWQGSAPKTLDISNSKLVLVQTLDETGAGNSTVIRPGAHLYPHATGPSRSIDSIHTVVVAPLCNTSSDGSVTVTVFSPDAGPFQYDWTGGSCSPVPCTGNPLNGISNGSYLLTITDLSDFEQFQQFIQVIAPNPIGVNFTKRRPKCFGQCNGSITANVVVGSGTPPYTYSWNTTPVQNTQIATGLCAGIYILTVTDAHLCVSTFTTTLTQPTAVAANVTFTNLSCFGVCNGTASSSPSGGNVPTGYTYSWTGPGGPYSTQNLASLCIGTYNVTVRDDSLCTGSGSVTITQPTALVVTPAHTNVSCFGLCDGTASVSPVSGGSPGYSYLWSGPGSLTGQGTPTITGLCAGAYSVIVTDANGCTSTTNFTITQPAAIIATATSTNVPCFGQCVGTASVAVAGGAGGTVFNWLPGNPTGDGTANVTGLCAGTYSATVTDLNGCADTGIVVITQPTLLVPNPTSTNVVCFGQCNGTASAAPTGGTGVYTYLWTGSVPGPYTGQGTPNLTNLCPGTYSVTVTDANGCDTMQSVTVTQPPVLTLTIAKTNVTCNGACNGTATATAGGGSPGYTYVWSGPGALTGQGTPSLTGLCPGVYSLTITDANGCTKTVSVTITQPNILNATLSATTLLCNGDCNATITSTISGGTPGYTFSWSPGGQTTASITNQCAGIYTLTVTDSKGCIKVVSTTITQPTPLVAITSSTNVTCFGLCNGTANVIAGGGTPGYTYSWAPGGQTTTSISGLCAGSYTATVTDANGCTQTSVVTITSPPQLLGNPFVVNNVLCAGQCNGSASSAVTGGTGNPASFNYNWNGAATPVGDGTPTITSLCPGIYTLVVTDSNLCTSSQSVTITQPTVLSAPITGSTSSCNICNGTATVTPSGGVGPYTYLWAPTGQTTQTAVGLCPNITYTVTVTDANLCTATSSVTILQTIIITITTSNTTLSCFGACDGIATANPSGGLAPYTYLWVNTGTGATVSSSQTASGLCAGTYAVTVVDANGCLNTATVIFTNPPILDITAVHTDETCGGSCDGTATATATGGTGAFTYQWLPGGQTTPVVSGLCTGTYTCTVTDASGCSDTVSVIVSGPSVITDNAVVTDANCLLADGTITVAPTGGSGAGYTYLWVPGASIGAGQGTATVSGLLPGSYSVLITDNSGCAFVFNYLLNNVNGPNVSMAHTDVTCNNVCDGTATATVSAGVSPYTFDWASGSPAGDGTNAITALCGTTTYTLTVTDAAGCITVDTARIINPLPISPNEVVVNESCGGTCDGSITLAPTGGSGTYSYAWSGGLPPTATQTNLCATGSPYTVTITDGNGCDTTITISISSPPALIVSLSSSDVLCNGACNGTDTASVIGGTGAGTYTYSWSHGGAFILPTVVGLCPGQYIVTVTDGNGCIAKDTSVITEPTPLTSFTSQTNVSCNGVCDGTATVTAGGGTAPYTYSWSPGAVTTAIDSFLCAGSYNPVVTDFNGCVSTPPPVVITQPAAILPGLTVNNPNCNSACDGTASVITSGGTSPYTYFWGPGAIAGQGTTAVSSLCAGTYILVVTDSMGCTNNQNFTLTDPATLIANTTSTSPTCMNSCNGTATATPVGGTPGYSYSWSPSGGVTQTVSSLCPGIYTVTVTDSKNCVATQAVTVINPAPIDIAISSTPAACGVCDGSFVVTPISGTPSFTYAWTGGLPAINNPTNICAGLYDVTVTDLNGCDSIFTIPMNNSGGATGETVTTSDVTCSGMCNGTGSIIPIGGVSPFTYLWNDGPPPTADSAAINLCAGNYFVQVTDSNTCIHFSPVTINQPAPILANGAVTNAICSNVCTGAIALTPTGGTGAYTYAWTPAAAITAGQGTPNVTGLCPGTYTVTITDANLCTSVDSFTVNQTAPLSVTVSSTNISCASTCNGMAYVTITAGTAPFTIQWDDALGQTNDTATALCAGNYTATITDANGCSTSVSVTITATPAIAANPTITNANCGLCDGSATLVPTGGTAPFTYLWSNGQTTANASSLCAGLYTVNITDASGCAGSFPIPVSNTGGPTGLTITSTNVTCNGSCNGAVTAVTPTGGTAPYTYLWIASGQTTPAIGSLCAGVYFIQVTDAIGCSILDSVTITEPSPILANQVITASTCGLCDGSITIAPSGGTSPYTVLWNTGSGALSLTNLCAGVYSVQITDAAGCVVNVVVPLNSQNAPSLAMSSTNVSCNGVCDGTGTVVASSGTAPYAYLWNDVGAQTTPTASALCAGNYALQVTGADGCIAVTTLTITEPTAIGFSLASANDPLCNGDSTGSITTIPSGGTLGYTYAWSPIGGTAATANNLPANVYTVTVTDANGCTATQATTLVQTAVLTIGSVTTSPSCNTINDGAIDVTVSGGTNSYTYQWSGGSSATTEDLTGILAGTYTINVTDGNGCTIADTSTLIPITTVIAVAGNDTTFCQNGSITLDASGSTNGINFQWFEVGNPTSLGTTASISVSPTSGVTNYYVIVDNGSGCPDNDTVVVTANVLPNANAGADASLVIGQSVTIGGSPTTSTLGATISWLPIPGLDNATAANPVAAPTSTTTYTVTVTSAQGCSISDSVIVTVLPSIVIPDGISPNADGDNDEWIIDGIELFPNCNVEVYNRWGELLFQSVGYKEHWKGTYKGKELPVGTYYYIIDLKDPLYPDAYTGPITILR